MTIFKSPEYSCLRTCNVDDAKVIDWICTESKLIRQSEGICTVIGAVGGGERVWRRHLFAWEEESVRECSVLLYNTVLQVNVHDARRWLLDPIHDYSVKGAYHFLTTTGEPLDRTMVDDV